MKFREFERKFHHHQLITTQEIKNAFRSYDRKQLSLWERKGWVVRIRKGKYLLHSKINKVDKELLANEIKDSYISLEYALNYYNFIPEIPQKITSTTNERTETIETPLGIFVYQHVQPQLFGGYKLIDSQVSTRKIKIAKPTKALFDFIYLGNCFEKKDYQSLRFNLEEVVSLFKPVEFKLWTKKIKSPVYLKKLNKFFSYIKNDA